MKKAISCLCIICALTGSTNISADTFPFSGKATREKMEAKNTPWQIKVSDDRYDISHQFPKVPLRSGDYDNEEFYGRISYATRTSEDEQGNLQMYGLIYVYNPQEADPIFRSNRDEARKESDNEEDMGPWKGQGLRKFLKNAGITKAFKYDFDTRKDFAVLKSTKDVEEFFLRIDEYKDDGTNSALNWIRFNYLEDRVIVTVHAIMVNRLNEDDDPVKNIKEDWSFHNSLKIIKK